MGSEKGPVGGSGGMSRQEIGRRAFALLVEIRTKLADTREGLARVNPNDPDAPDWLARPLGTDDE